MKQTLTVSEWHAMAQSGSTVPMRILIHGNSMYPLVRYERDMVTIMPLEEKPGVGDIVLFFDQPRDRYVLHRVWQAEEDRVLTWGDNCPGPDGWMPWDRVLGKVVLIERGKRNIKPDRAKGLRLARFWHRVGWIHRWLEPRKSRFKVWALRLIGRTPGGKRR